MDSIVLVRYFNLGYAIILAGFVVVRMFQGRYKVYRWANAAYLVSFVYSIVAYLYSFHVGYMNPIISALGATVQISAMLTAILTQVEWKK